MAFAQGFYRVAHGPVWKFYLVLLGKVGFICVGVNAQLNPEAGPRSQIKRLKSTEGRKQTTTQSIVGKKRPKQTKT